MASLSKMILSSGKARKNGRDRRTQKVVEEAGEWVLATNTLIDSIRDLMREKDLSEDEKRDAIEAVTYLDQMANVIRTGGLDFRLNNEKRHEMMAWLQGRTQ